MSECHYSDCDCNGWESMCDECQDQVGSMKHRVMDLEEFVKAWDGYTDFDPLPHRIICGITNHLPCTCGVDELMALRKKIGVI